MHESGIATSGMVFGVEEIADELSRMKAHKYTFSYYDRSDISQEIYLMVHEASGRFDPSQEKKPISFFNVHTNNRLRNLIRDRRAIDSVSLPDIVREDNSFQEDLNMRDMVEFIEMGLPSPRLKDAFNRMLNYGGEGVTQYMKIKVRNIVLRLLKRYKDE